MTNKAGFYCYGCYVRLFSYYTSPFRPMTSKAQFYCYGCYVRLCSYYPRASVYTQLLRATRGARNPNPELVVTHASHVCSQHLFELLPSVNEMHITQFDQARFDPLSLVKIWSPVFWPSVTRNLRKAQRWSKNVLTFDRCSAHSVTFGYY